MDTTAPIGEDSPLLSRTSEMNSGGNTKGPAEIPGKKATWPKYLLAIVVLFLSAAAIAKSFCIRSVRIQKLVRPFGTLNTRGFICMFAAIPPI